MKAGRQFAFLSLVVIATLLLGACAAPAPQVVTQVQTQVVEKVVTQVVEKQSTVVVENEKLVEKVQTQVVEKVVEKQVEVTPTPGPANPYRPEDLFKLSAELKEATKSCTPPSGAKYALLTNAVAPFWTAAQTGASRASSEINVPITFMFPTAAEKLSQQISMLETFVNDKYNAITFSAIDRDAPKPIIEKAVAQGIPILTTDSDATGSERSLYIGMSDYDAGKAAGEAAKKIIGKGKVVGLVGYATAQNAQDRIQGVKDAFEGSELELVEVLLDDIKPEVALSNAQTAMQKYPDLAGFITFYSYDGPAACQAVKQAGADGQGQDRGLRCRARNPALHRRGRSAGDDRPARLLLRLPLRADHARHDLQRRGSHHEAAGSVSGRMAQPGDQGHGEGRRGQDPPEHGRGRHLRRHLPALSGVPDLHRYPVAMTA